MSIKEITKYKTRCTHPTKSSGTGYFNSIIGQCGRVASIDINGQALCTQHAGAIALKILIEKQRE